MQNSSFQRALDLQKEPISAERCHFCRKMPFLQKDPLSVLSVFRQKGISLEGSLSAFCRMTKFLFRSTTTPGGSGVSVLYSFHTSRIQLFSSQKCTAGWPPRDNITTEALVERNKDKCSSWISRKELQICLVTHYKERGTEITLQFASKREITLMHINLTNNLPWGRYWVTYTVT